MAVIARNLIDTPRFPTAADASGSAWRYWHQPTRTWKPLTETRYIDTRAGADPLTGGTAYRITANNETGSVVLMHPIGNLEAGASVYVNLRYAASNDPQTIGIVPLDPGSGVIGGGIGRMPGMFENSQITNALEYNDPKQTGYQFRDHTFTIPEINGERIVDVYGSVTGSAGATADHEWALVVFNTSGGATKGVVAGIGGARVDVGPYPDGFVTGYLDGSMQPAGDTTYSWTGTPFASDSVAEVTPAVIIVPKPAAPIADDEANTLIIPAGDGAEWTINGEPAVPGTYDVEGDETVAITLRPADGYAFADESGPSEWEFTFTANAIEVIPAAPAFDDTLFEYTIPEVAGVAYSVNGSPTAAGTYSAEPEQSVTITAAALDGYTLPGGASPWWQHEFPAAPIDPDPEPDPDAWPDPEAPAAEHIIRGGDDVAALMRYTDEEDIEICRKAYEVVLMTAWGYTRGRGFSDTLEPTYPIRRVIDLAAIRLAANPEQVLRWAIAGDSETLSPFQGFTLAERHVLDRYRRRSA